MNSVFLEVGSVQIYWYSIILIAAFLLGGVVTLIEARKWNISEDFMINLFFYIILFGLIGARLYYVAFNWDYYSNDLSSIYRVWEGGLAIHGGIIASLIFVIFYSKKYKINTMRLLDILVVSLILGQAIGRWGNFMNGEAHGAVTTLTSLESLHIPEFVINGMYIDGTYYIPTFFYESILCFIGFIVLLIFRRLKYTKIGQPTALYLVWYGVVRFFIEQMRTDSLMLGDFKIAQIVSICMIIAGATIFIIAKKKSVFDNQYNDEKNIEHSNF